MVVLALSIVVLVVAAVVPVGAVGKAAQISDSRRVSSPLPSPARTVYV